MRSRTIATTSPGLAWRPKLALEKIKWPSNVTSKRPLDEGSNSTVLMIGAQLDSRSSVRPTARGM